MEELIKTLEGLNKNFLLYILLKLMKRKVFTFHELAEVHAKYLESLEKAATDEYMQLQGMVVKMWSDKKKNHMTNLKEIMHHLLNKGKINMTHEQIDER